jgi:1-acyl-sn-glycerol-3-phosphate acyltransferase
MEAASSAGRPSCGSAIERAARLRWIAENLCALHGVKIEVHGAIPDGPCALVANHVSYLDPVAILSQVAATAIAKREVSTWPCLGAVMGSLGVLWVDRACAWSGARVLRGAARAWAAGVPVLAFPEGTTTRGDDVLPFRRGLFGIALRARVPVVPVTLAYDDPGAPWVGGRAFLPHYVRTAARPTTRVSLWFERPIEPRGAGAAELAEHARSIVRARLLGAERRAESFGAVGGAAPSAP